MAYHATAVSIGSTVSWGVSAKYTNLPSSIDGVVVGVNLNKGVESAPCRNELGTKIGEAVYDITYSGSITVQVGAGVGIESVKLFDRIQVSGGGNFRVKNCELTESNQDYKKFRLQVESSAVDYGFTDVSTIGLSGK